MTKIYKRGISYFLMCSFLFLLGCSDRSGTITGPQVSITSNNITLNIQTDKTIIGLEEPFTLTIRVVCNSCTFDGEGTFEISYTSNNKIKPNNDSASFVLVSGQSESSFTKVFSGLLPSERGTALITATFVSGSVVITANSKVVIE